MLLQGGYNTAATIPSQPGGDQQQQPPQQQQQQPPQQQQQAAYMSYYPPNAAPMSYPFMNPSGKLGGSLDRLGVWQVA